MIKLICKAITVRVSPVGIVGITEQAIGVATITYIGGAKLILEFWDDDERRLALNILDSYMDTEIHNLEEIQLAYEASVREKSRVKTLKTL